MRGARLGTLILLPAWLVLSLAWSAAAVEPVDYGKDVKGVLKSRCFACHGALKQEAMLRLDTVAGMQKGGESGPVVKAGDLAGTLIISRITHADPDELAADNSRYPRQVFFSSLRAPLLQPAPFTKISPAVPLVA